MCRAICLCKRESLQFGTTQEAQPFELFIIPTLRVFLMIELHETCTEETQKFSHEATTSLKVYAWMSNCSILASSHSVEQK